CAPTRALARALGDEGEQAVEIPTVRGDRVGRGAALGLEVNHERGLERAEIGAAVSARCEGHERQRTRGRVRRPNLVDGWTVGTGFAVVELAPSAGAGQRRGSYPHPRHAR